jgi:hypothetical protein
MRSFRHRQWHLDEVMVKIKEQSGMDCDCNPAGGRHTGLRLKHRHTAALTAWRQVCAA